jgi:hypothetical protein
MCLAQRCLSESDWDAAAAFELLRKRGLAAAAKKASRQACEGLVGVATAPGLAAIVEVNSETDFVARTENFTRLVSQAAQAVLSLGPSGEVSNGEVELEKVGGQVAGAACSCMGAVCSCVLDEVCSSVVQCAHACAACCRALGVKLLFISCALMHAYAHARPGSACVSLQIVSPRMQALAMGCPGTSSGSLGDACAEVAAQVRENVKLRRAFLVSSPAGKEEGRGVCLWRMYRFSDARCRG